MKKLIILSVLGICCLSVSLLAKQSETNKSNIKDSITIAQQGCCSHHQGVCGCSPSGITLCCDGTASPSCHCQKPDNLKDKLSCLIIK